MWLDELFETDFSVRKTVWSKRGETITRRDVDRVAPTDLPSRTTIEITKEDDDDES